MFWVIAKGDAREVGHTISDSPQYLACIMFINLFSADIFFSLFFLLFFFYILRLGLGG